LLLEVSNATREISDRGSLMRGAARCELVAHQHGKQPVGRIIVRGNGRALLGEGQVVHDRRRCAARVGLGQTGRAARGGCRLLASGRWRAQAA
jgi:hypothetical protein